MTTTVEARDAILELLRTAWLANPASAAVPLLFEDVRADRPEVDADGRAEPWALASVRHSTGEQDTLGASGRRRFLYGGEAAVQIFAPLQDGLRVSDILVGVARGAFLSTPPTSPVWFFDVRQVEVGPHGPWFRTDLLATFRYQEVA